MEGRGAAACVLLSAAALVAPAAASARREHLSVKPRVGDVNTRFVYRGSGWRPHANVFFSHGALCNDRRPCAMPLYVGRVRTGRNGRFKTSEHPLAVPDDFVGYSICFGYGPEPLPPGCRASGRITIVPASASVTPARAERFTHGGFQPVLTLAVQHFKAGEKLAIEIRYPDGRVRTLHGHTRRHPGAVGTAYARRGGLVRSLEVKSSDPDGSYQVRVMNHSSAEADATYTVTTSRD